MRAGESMMPKRASSGPNARRSINELSRRKTAGSGRRKSLRLRCVGRRTIPSRPRPGTPDSCSLCPPAPPRSRATSNLFRPHRGCGYAAGYIRLHIEFAAAACPRGRSSRRCLWPSGMANWNHPRGYTRGLHQRPLTCSKTLFYGAFSKPLYCGGEGGLRTPDTSSSPVLRHARPQSSNDRISCVLRLSSSDQDDVAPPLLRRWDFPEFNEEREVFKNGFEAGDDIKLLAEKLGIELELHELGPWRM